MPDSQPMSLGLSRVTFRRVASAAMTILVLGVLVLTGLTQYRLLTRVKNIESDLSLLRKNGDFGEASRAGQGGDLPLPNELLSLDGAALKGQRSARVALIEFADFECSFCGIFAHETLPRLQSEYVATGKVLLAFRHLPLSHVHSGAVRAAEAAECAGLQNQFWEMHDKLFMHQGEFALASLETYAGEIGLRLDRFKTCLQGRTSAKVKSDAAAAGKIGVSGTPTFAIGLIEDDGRVKVVELLVGARSFAELSSALDKALVATKSL